MTKAKFHKVIALLLALIMTVSSLSVVAFATAGYEDSDTSNKNDTVSSNYSSSSYKDYWANQETLFDEEIATSDVDTIDKYKDKTMREAFEELGLDMDADEFFADLSHYTTDVETTKDGIYLYKNGTVQHQGKDSEKEEKVVTALETILQDLPADTTVIYLPEEGEVSFYIDVEVPGYYGIKMEYFSYAKDGKISSPEKRLEIDDKLLCSECTAIAFQKNWMYDYTVYEAVENGLYIFVADPNGRFTLNNEAKTKGNYVLKSVAKQNGWTSVDNVSYMPGFVKDKNGNDSRAEYYQYGDSDASWILPEWRTYTATDSTGFYNGDFQFYFEEARTYKITLGGVREGILLKSLSLYVTEDLQTYDEYWNELSAKNYPVGNQENIVKIEAELPFAVSDSSVYPANDRSSAITTPSNAAAQLMNVMGKTGYSTVGQWAAYEFQVTKTGLYKIASRYSQKTLEGLFASRGLKMWSSDPDDEFGLADGTPTYPFKEANQIRFNYSSDWQSEFFGYYDSNNQPHPFTFYFKEGVTYRIYLEVSLGQMAEHIETVQNSLNIINDSYLSILKLTGPSPDEYRDYGFKRVLPEQINNLVEQATVLQGVVDEMKKITGASGSNTATLVTIVELLTKMDDENEIAKNLSNLKSYIGNLGTWLNTVKSQAITMDFMQIQPATEECPLPYANANFFESAWFEICAFVTSFFTDYNAMGVDENVDMSNSIDVWLAYGRDQSLIWRGLITDGFSAKKWDNDGDGVEDEGSQIPVQLKLVTGGTLLPSVLCGQGPDVYIGLGSTDTINYAIRSAIVPLYINEDAPAEEQEKPTIATDDEYNNIIVPSFPESATVPLTLYGKLYGIPETSSFQMMFLRDDIMENLGLSAPETWDDILAAVPVLQANNMLVGITYGSAFKIYLYQREGGMWLYNGTDGYAYDAEYAGAKIGYETNTALETFTDVCRLYTDYSFPVSFDAANRFRTGEMPIVISDYVNTYNQLVVFATEIAGLWHFTSIPGTYVTDYVMVNEKGEEDDEGQIYKRDANGEKIAKIDTKTGKEAKELHRDSMTTITASVMMYKEDRVITDTEIDQITQNAWKFIMWQCGAEAQADYGNKMVALIGPSAKYATANMAAVKDLSWTAAEQDAIEDQMKHLSAIENYPGSYYIGRYEQFAFLAAYNDGKPAAEALQSYLTVINKELNRKREEFGLYTLKDGQTPSDARAERAELAQ